MDLMTIGTFAGRTRLSAKALRLYDRLGLLPPARVDPDSGYQFYREDQVATARLIALLRRLGMPLPAIADITAKPPGAAAAAVGAYWSDVESVTADRRVLASYIQAKLTGGDMPSYDITTRALPQRTIVSISRHLHAAETGAFFADAFGRLRSAAPGLEGIAGCPYLIFYGDVSDDSDGPLELARSGPRGRRPGSLGARPAARAGRCPVPGPDRRPAHRQPGHPGLRPQHPPQVRAEMTPPRS